MLTLNELRKEIGELPEKDEKAPSYRRLMESDEKILAKHVTSSLEVTVYENGYVSYLSGAGATVFPFPESKSYVYKSSCGVETVSIKASNFDNMDWYFRLVLEGEDRLSHNEDSRLCYKLIFYGDFSEEWKKLKDPVGSAEDVYFSDKNEETALDSLHLLTDKQRYVVTEHFLKGVPYIKLAQDLGISRQAVRDAAENALQRMRKRLGQRN